MNHLSNYVDRKVREGPPIRADGAGLHDVRVCRQPQVPSDPGTHALGDRYSVRNRRVTISPLFKGVLARYPAHVPIGSLR